MYLILSIVRDRSASTPSYRTDTFDATNLDQCINRVALTGGQISYSEVESVSTTPLDRLTLTAPPTPPSPTALSSDLHEASAQKNQQIARAREHQRAVGAWTASSKPAIATFRAAVLQRLAAPRSAKRSDYATALRRIATFFGEPTPAHVRGEPLRVLLIIGDGRHNAGERLPNTLPGNPIVVVVNGYGEVAALAPYKPVVFESVDAAITYIIELKTAGGAS
jgi:hypothetical protein